VGGPGSWTATGGAWFLPYNQVFNGRPQDTVGVVIGTPGNPMSRVMLTRVETLAACQATAGTYYFPWDEALAVISGVDDEDFGADLELAADDGSELYVHLTGDADPNTMDVVALTVFGSFIGTKENPSLYVQPILGGNLAVDGGLEDWFSAFTLNQWTTQQSAKGVGTLNQDTALVDDGGLYSAKLTVTGGAAGTVGIRQAITLQPGKGYRFSGSYRTEPGTTVTGRIAAPAAGATALSEDGRSQTTNGADIRPTEGDVRRFSFDMNWPTGGTHVECRLSTPGGVNGSVWYDKLAVQRIYGWLFFEGNLTTEVPEFTQSASDVYPGTEEGGSGQITLLNHDAEGVAGITGLVEGMLSRWTFSNKRVVIMHGGQFEDGQDILWEDMAHGFTGLIRKPGANDDRGRFDLEEYRAFLQAKLPVRRYNALDVPGAPAAARDRHRSYWFGYHENVSPQQVDTVAASGLPVYELADPAIAPNASVVIYTSAGALDNVWVYEDLDAAAAKDATRRKELTLTTDYTIEASTARITLVRNPYIVRIVAGENDRLDFTQNGNTWAAEIPPGLYTIHELKATLQTLMNALAGAVYTWSFTESSGGVPEQKYSVAYSGAGSNVFKLADGTNKDRSIFETIGYTGDDNLTGATLTADTAMPYSADSFPLRVDNDGYRDDASGTYTGTPNGRIFLASDILRVLLVKVLGTDAATQISSSFITARATCPQEHAVYLGGLTSVQGGASFDLALADVISRFEAGCFADVILDAAGVFHFVARSATVPANAVTYYDYDYLDWWVDLPVEETYGFVRVNFYQDPTTGSVLGRETTNDEAIHLHEQTVPRTFDTFLRFESDAANALEKVATLAERPIRHYRFRTAGRGAAHKVGDIVRLNRSRSVQSPTETALVNTPARIMQVAKNPIDGSVSYVAHTNVIAA
jgi:hypothetical protein